MLGSTLNWAAGRYLYHFRERRWFPLGPRTVERAERSYLRWGHWSLLLSWMPVIGDPLTLVSGLLRTPLKLFLAMVTLAKFVRYLVVAGAVGLL